MSAGAALFGVTYLNLTTMSKCVLYARVSSKEQEEEGYSLPDQEKKLRAYAEKNKFTIVKTFSVSEAASVANKRKIFKEMINFIKEKNIQHIISWKVDRITRNIFDTAEIYRLALYENIQIHLTGEDLTLHKDMKSNEKFEWGVKAIFAEHLINSMKDEVKRGMKSKIEHGWWPHKAPIGYKNVVASDKEHIIEINPVTAPLITKAFKLYATDNYSLKTLNKALSKDGFHNTKGKAISNTHLQRILKNPFYYGQMKWKEKLYPGKHPPLITKEEFDAVQMVFNKKDQPNPKYGTLPFTFKGLMVCGTCGCSVTAEKKKGKYIYYHCTKFKGNCNEKMIREEELEKQFIDLFLKIHIKEDILAYLGEKLKENHQKEIEYHNQISANLQRDYSRFKTRLDTIYEDKLDNKIPEEMYERKYQEYTYRLEEIEKDIKKHRLYNQKYHECGLKIIELANKAYSLYKQSNSEEKRELLKFVLSHLSLKSKKLVPTYKKPFDLIIQHKEHNTWLSFYTEVRTYFKEKYE